MLLEIENNLNQAKKSWETAKKVPVNVRQLVMQIAGDIRWAIDQGDWGLAVRLASYCHEIAKAFNCLDWYSGYISVRKMRDAIEILHISGKNSQ